MGRSNPIPEWVSANLIPLVFDEKYTFLQMLGAVRVKINELVDQNNQFDAQRQQILAYVAGVQEMVNTTIVQTATALMTPIVQGELPAIFEPFRAEVLADFAENVEQTDAVRDQMRLENAQLQANITAENAAFIAAERQRIYNDTLALVAVLVGGGGAPGDTTPPGPVTDLTATPADMSLVLAWTNPTEGDFAGVVIRRAEGAVAPATATDGVLVWAGNASTYTDTGLNNGQAYSYSVFALDAVPNYAAAASVTATPAFQELTWSFDSAVVPEALAGWTINKQGIAITQTGGGILNLLNYSLADTTNPLYTLPFVKGRRVEFEWFATFGPNRVNPKWAPVVGLTRPFENMPSAPLSRDDLRVAVAATYENGYKGNHMYRDTDGLWYGNSGAGWAANFLLGDGTINNMTIGVQRVKTVLETTATQFRFSTYALNGTLLSQSPWTNFTEVLDNDDPGDMYLALGCVEFGEGGTAQYPGKIGFYHITIS